MRHALSARRNGSSPASPASAMTSAIVFSKNCDAMPVAPTEPISSLSTSTVIAVRSGTSSASASCATSDVYAHTRSSWPYPITIDRSNPQSRARPAGTTSISADRKSSSSIP